MGMFLVALSGVEDTYPYPSSPQFPLFCSAVELKYVYQDYFLISLLASTQ